MMVLSRVLRNAVAGVAVIGGVGSLFALGIMYGVKVAYADSQISVLNAGNQHSIVLTLDDIKRSHDAG